MAPGNGEYTGLVRKERETSVTPLGSHYRRKELRNEREENAKN